MKNIGKPSQCNGMTRDTGPENKVKETLSAGRILTDRDTLAMRNGDVRKYMTPRFFENQ